jgi:hypothetical protein
LQGQDLQIEYQRYLGTCFAGCGDLLQNFD